VKNENLPEYYSFDPNALIDMVKVLKNLKSDHELAVLLGFSPPVISKIRRFRTPVTGLFLISMHELTGLSIARLRAAMGDYRPHFPYGNQRRQRGGQHQPLAAPSAFGRQAMWK